MNVLKGNHGVWTESQNSSRNRKLWRCWKGDRWRLKGRTSRCIDDILITPNSLLGCQCFNSSSAALPEKTSHWVWFRPISGSSMSPNQNLLWVNQITASFFSAPKMNLWWRGYLVGRKQDKPCWAVLKQLIGWLSASLMVMTSEPWLSEAVCGRQRRHQNTDMLEPSTVGRDDTSVTSNGCCSHKACLVPPGGAHKQNWVYLITSWVCRTRFKIQCWTDWFYMNKMF